MLPAKAHEIAAEWSHLYPDYCKNHDARTSAARMLFRDLNALGAVSVSGEWTLSPRCLDCGHRHGGRAYGLCLVDGCDCIVVKRAAA